MLPTRNSNYGIGRRIAPDTFVNDAIEERSHPHFYCDAAGLVALFAGFELLSLTQREHKKPGSWHWHILAERLAGYHARGKHQQRAVRLSRRDGDRAVRRSSNAICHCVR